MTVRRQALLIAALATAFVVAACGGAGATTTPVRPTPTDAGPPSLDRSTFDLSTLDLSSFDLGSFAIPSFVGNEELEALLPDTIGGQPVTKQSVNGQAFIDMGLGAAFEDILADVGATPSDLGVAIGTAGSVEIRAYQIEGQSAEQIFAGLEAAFQAGGAGTVTEIAVGGRTVSQVTTSAETSYAYLSGEVVFIVGGSVTPELLEDAVSQLPAP
jgi:hypothetical protein